jgi:hypothetical protein
MFPVPFAAAGSPSNIERRTLNIERRTKRKSLRRDGDHRSPRASEEEGRGRHRREEFYRESWFVGADLEGTRPHLD